MHPIIKALIETLPEPGAEFPTVARSAWLKMMDTAFALAFPPVSGDAPAPKRGRPKKPKTAARTVEPQFYIDVQGIARRNGGERIMPKDVEGHIVDDRGEHGDLGTIIWADDTRGIPKGIQLDVTISG